MGSEKEVDEEIIVKNRPLVCVKVSDDIVSYKLKILVHVSKNKTDLGKGLVLVDSVEGSVTEYRPPADSTVSELKRMELNAGIQVIPTLADKSIQAAP